MGWDSSSHILLTAPISIADLTYATGIASNDLGTQLSTGSWNKWAKYKGIDSTEVGILTAAQRKNADWGLQYIPVWASKTIGKMSNFWYEIDTSSTNQPDCGVSPEYWIIKKPAHKYRILDFDGYQSTAEAPISSPAAFISLAGGVTLYCNLGAMGGNTLSYQDFAYGGTDGTNMYFGYMLRQQGTSTIYYITKSAKISAEWSTNLTIPSASASSIINKTWDIFPFLSNTAVTTLSSNMNQSGTFVALLDYTRIAINQPKADYTLTVLGAFYDVNTDARNVYYSFTVKNNEASYNLTNITVTITLYKEDGQTVVDTQTKSNTSLAAGGTWSVDDYYRASSNSIAASIKWVRVVLTAMSQSFDQQGATVAVTLGPSPY